MIWFANSLLVRQPNGYNQMAVYASANNLRILVLVLPNILNTVSLSILNHIKGSGDLHKYRSLFKKNVTIISGAAICCAIFVGFFGKHILSIFGKNYSGGAAILNILLLVSVLEAATTALYQFIQSQGKIWNSLLMINIPREALLVLLTIALVPEYGASGLASAFVGSYTYGIISTSVLVWYLRKRSIRNPDLQPYPLETFRVS
jgi:O-antigen/teichoic acid export membrane protein